MGSSIGSLIDFKIRTSRLFAGPGQYPPKEFAAYAIIAFRSAVTDESHDRYLAICTGFLAGISSSAELEERGVSKAEQMVTVWPLRDSYEATRLNYYGTHSYYHTFESEKVCPTVIESIDLSASLDAIQKAKQSLDGQILNGEGPYLLAWSPADTYGEQDALVLAWDLSNIINSEQATRMFSDWAVEIEKNPQIWSRGWNMEKLRVTLRLWADKYGTGVLEILGLGEE